jgi:hypothetical protein
MGLAAVRFASATLLGFSGRLSGRLSTRLGLCRAFGFGGRLEAQSHQLVAEAVAHCFDQVDQ